MKSYTVISPLQLTYGSHSRDLGGTSVRTLAIGERVQHDSDSPNGNVWFIDKNGQRGKIEAGEIGNLLRSRRIEAAGTPRGWDKIESGAESPVDAAEIVRALAGMTTYEEDGDGEDAKEVLNHLIQSARKTLGLS